MPEQPLSYRDRAQAMLKAAQPRLELSTDPVPYGTGRASGGVAMPIAPGVEAFARGSMVPFQGAPMSAADRRLTGGLQFRW